MNTTCQVSNGNTDSNCEFSGRSSGTRAWSTYRPQLTTSSAHQKPRLITHMHSGMNRLSTTKRPMMLNGHGPISSSRNCRIAYHGGG